MFSRLDVSADDISDLDDLARLPVLTKNDIRNAGERFFAGDIPRGQLSQDATGGSTGTPFVFWHRREDKDYLNGNLWRANEWMGYAPGARTARVWGCDPVSRRQQLTARYIGNTILLPGHDMSDQGVATFCDEMRRFRTTIIEGYGHLLWEFCRTLRRLGIPPPPTLRVAVFGAEVLGSSQRSFIREVLHCPVRERYGSREFLAIAAECDSGSLHVTSDVNWIEIVDDNGNPVAPGELGRIAVTCLHSYAFPLVRYAIGDLGVMSSERCSCGSPHPVLQEVSGRSGNLLLLPDGTRMTGLAVAHRMRMLDRVGQVQIRQTSPDTLSVLVARTPDSREEDVQQLLGILADLTKGLVSIGCKYVDEIPRSPSGKYELVRSDLPTTLSGSISHR